MGPCTCLGICICSGGVENLAEAHSAIEKTSADGVMVSEAILDNPRIFDGVYTSTHAYPRVFSLSPRISVPMTEELCIFRQ